jgi:putative membrane protein
MINGWYGAGWGAGSWIAMVLMMLFFWGAVVTVVLLLLRRRHPDDGPAASRHPSLGSAEHILDERFARGEIDADEYTARRDMLRRAE